MFYFAFSVTKSPSFISVIYSNSYQQTNTLWWFCKSFCVMKKKKNFFGFNVVFNFIDLASFRIVALEVIYENFASK